MEVRGIQGAVEFDGVWITITKKKLGKSASEFRLRAADVTGTRLKPGTRLFHGYIQFVLPGSAPASTARSGLSAGRPPASDPHSLSIPRRSNDAAAKLVAAVEQVRG